MICHKSKTFCASSGTCVNTECDRWINIGGKYELPVSLNDFQDGPLCAGYKEAPAWTALQEIMQ